MIVDESGGVLEKDEVVVDGEGLLELKPPENGFGEGEDPKSEFVESPPTEEDLALVQAASLFCRSDEKRE